MEVIFYLEEENYHKSNTWKLARCNWVDISELKIGDFIYIKDLRSDKFSFLAPDNAVVVGVKTARAAIVDEVDEEEGEEGEEGAAAEGGEAPASTEDKSSEEKPAAKLKKKETRLKSEILNCWIGNPGSEYKTLVTI